MKTLAQRQEERRKLQLEAIDRQIKEGTLVVRKMTPEERAKYPPRPQPKRRPRS